MKCIYCGLEIDDEDELVWIRIGEGIRMPMHRRCYEQWARVMD